MITKTKTPTKKATVKSRPKKAVYRFGVKPKNIFRERIHAKMSGKLTSKETIEVELSHNMMLIARVMTEGFEETFETSSEKDKTYLLQFKDFKTTQLSEEVQKMEQEMYSL